jgi:hypothetical protein
MRRSIGVIAGQLLRFFRKLLGAALFEGLAIQLDLFFDFAAGHRLVAEDLKGVEQLAVFFGEQACVASEQPHDDLRLILLGANLELQFGQFDHARVPDAHDAGLLRLRPLLGDFAGKTFEVTGLKVVGRFAPRSAVAAAGTPAAIAAIPTASAATIAIAIAASTSAATTAAGTSSRTGSRRCGLLDRCSDRPFVHFGFDDDPFEAAEKTLLLQDHVISQLHAVDAERFGRHRQCFVEILAFESLRHRRQVRSIIPPEGSRDR